MKIGKVEGFPDKYRALSLAIILSLIYIVGDAQTYNPSLFTVTNKSLGVAQSVPTDARSQFWDNTNLVARDYASVNEVWSYLNLPKYRQGGFPIYIRNGGILGGGGVWVGGTRQIWWFKDSTGNANLVRWYTDSSGIAGGPFFAVANNLSEGVPATIKTNLSLNNVDNTSDATKNSASVTLTNHIISGALNTFSNIPNSALANNSIGLSIGTSGTDIGVATTPAALGSSLVFQIPSAGVGSRGALTASDWNKFSNKLDSTSINSGDSVYDWSNGTPTLRYVIAAPAGTGITTLNGLTATVQVFATGTSGTDFNIVSGTATHTFNFPNSSGANRGLLTSTDWSTFNNKQSALSGTGYLNFTGTTPSYFTPTQVTADLNLFTSTLKGLVPLSGGGTTNFLRADGTWAAPPGGGGSGTVTSFSAGTLSPLFTTSVATATTTPALTFALSNAAANTVFGNFTGSSAAPGFGKVNLASMATNTANTLLGYDGSGNPADIPLTTTGSGAATITAGVLNIPTPSGTVTTTNSVTGNGSSGTPIKLVNDVATPGFNQRYGARWDGTKGYEFEGTDYVNILNFGADSTGVADISTALISALALGKPVYIPSGTWKWTAQVNMPEGGVIFGAFRYTKIKMSGNGYAAIKLARRCNIANLTFTGTYGSGADSSQIAISIDSTNESIIQNNVFDSVGIGVAVTKNGLEAGSGFFSRGNIITRNISAGCLYGIALRYRSEYNIVSENICNTNTIGIYQVGGNNLIRNNNVNSNVTGIYVSGWDNPNNNNGHNGIEGNAMNHNTYPIWLDSVTLGCRVLGNMMYFGEIHLRKCSNVTFESNDLSNNTIAGEANSFCIFQHNRIRIVTYNLNINGYDNMYFTNNLYEGSSYFPLDIRIPNGSGGLAIKTQFDTSLISLSLSGQFLSEYPTSLGIADSYLKQGSGTSSAADFLPWIQSKTHTGTGWGLLISPTVGADANAAYYSGVVAINSATTVSTIPLLKISNNLTTKFSVGPDGKTAIGSDSRVAWLSLPAGVATAGGAPIQFTAGPPTTVLVAGQMEYNTGLWIIDSSASVRDTIATRSWARNNITGGGGAVSSVSNSDGTLTISPTTAAVIASLALGHANTWTGKQTQPAPIFTGTTSAGANDSVMTIDPATGQTHWRSGIFNLYAANGLSISTVIADSVYLGGTLNQTTSIAGAGFVMNLGTSGSHLGDFNIYSDGGTMISNGSYQSAQGSQLLGAASTINNAVTSASGTVSNFSGYAFLAPTVTSTNATITYTNPATLRIDNSPTMSTNSTASGISYALDVAAGISHFGTGASSMSAIFDANISVNGGAVTNTSGLNIGASTTGKAALLMLPGVDPTTAGITTTSGEMWYNGTNLYFVDGSGTGIKRDLLAGVKNYTHTIFTPTTGGTVSLVNNQYNIINPAGALVALTVNLPSSPVNNDVVYIKFTQTVSTVTYANGTVADGITAPTAGGMTTLVYDSGSSTWF